MTSCLLLLVYHILSLLYWIPHHTFSRYSRLATLYIALSILFCHNITISMVFYYLLLPLLWCTVYQLRDIKCSLPNIFRTILSILPITAMSFTFCSAFKCHLPLRCTIPPTFSVNRNTYVHYLLLSLSSIYLFHCGRMFVVALVDRKYTIVFLLLSLEYFRFCFVWVHSAWIPECWTLPPP